MLAFVLQVVVLVFNNLKLKFRLSASVYLETTMRNAVLLDYSGVFCHFPCMYLHETTLV